MHAGIVARARAMRQLSWFNGSVGGLVGATVRLHAAGMSTTFSIEDLEADHRRAFTVASAIPAPRLAEVRSEIDRLLATGASFDEARTALQRLCAPPAEAAPALSSPHRQP
ncbi:MAG: hypothetical protein ACSLE9_15050 [Burkholderiaceae bacterium]